mgnify:CR=1 FL=1
MGRTRTALLQAAAGCVTARGARATTMGQLAREGGVAKATLYNHFRTKDEVLAALVDSRVAALGEVCLSVAGDGGLAAALERAAAGLAADDDDLADTVAGLGPRLLEQRELEPTSDEIRLPGTGPSQRQRGPYRISHRADARPARCPRRGGHRAEGEHGQD